MPTTSATTSSPPSSSPTSPDPSIAEFHRAAAASASPAAAEDATVAASASGTAPRNTTTNGAKNGRVGTSGSPDPSPQTTEPPKLTPAPPPGGGPSQHRSNSSGSRSAPAPTSGPPRTASSPVGPTPATSGTSSMQPGSSDDDATSPVRQKMQAVIRRLTDPKNVKSQKQVLLREDEIKSVLTEVREVFMSQPMHLRVEPPVRICGDIHGQFYDLLRIFDRCGDPSDQSYVFLGDYVDRGKHSVETIVLLYAYKVLYPEKMWLLRGNHECASINKMYGFYDDVKRRYNIRLFKQFTEVFNCMPLACSISDKILCMHGGISPELDDLSKIDALPRPADVPEKGLACDLLWADPEDAVEGFLESDRGVSYVFGADVVTDFLDLHQYDLVVRAHQVVERGYSFFADKQLVTVFSAPCYCGEFDNAGAVMSIDPQMRCSFAVFQ